MINYGYIQQAIDLYAKMGYTRIEVPWWASEWAVSVTAPLHGVKYHVMPNDKYLLASGEQAFLYLTLKDQLPPGRYQTVTPCFRADQYDRYHGKHFLKLELFESFKELRDPEHHASKCVNKAQEVLEQIGNVTLKIEQTSEVSSDLTYGGIEIGSYGARQMEGINWVYGTGIAEPRFSTVIGM